MISAASIQKVLLNKIIQTSQLLARFLLVAKSNPPGQAQEVFKNKNGQILYSLEWTPKSLL